MRVPCPNMPAVMRQRRNETQPGGGRLPDGSQPNGYRRIVFQIAGGVAGYVEASREANTPRLPRLPRTSCQLRRKYASLQSFMLSFGKYPEYISQSSFLLLPYPAYHLPCRFHGTTSALFRRGFSAVSKLTCFGKENNLISSAKQLVFPDKITYFAKQNNLFRKPENQPPVLGQQIFSRERGFQMIN